MEIEELDEFTLRRLRIIASGFVDLYLDKGHNVAARYAVKELPREEDREVLSTLVKQEFQARGVTTK